MNISSKKIDKADISLIIFHLLISLIFFVSYKEKFLPIDQLKNWIFGYYFGVPIILLGAFFRSLRQVKYFILWIIIGAIQLFMYFILKDNPEFFFFRGTSFDGLKALLPVLILFQIFRLNFKKKYKLELIISIRHHRFSLYEGEERRNILMIEVVYSILLLAAIIIFNSI